MCGLSHLDRAFKSSPAAEALQKTAAIFEKGKRMMGKAGETVKFVALFDPNNYAAQGPVGRLRAVGDVIRQMESVAGEIPGMGDLIKFHAEATDAFAGALTRLDEQVKEARDGSICGRSGCLLTELKVLDTYIMGGECLSFKTEYIWQAAMNPIKVWINDNSDEVFYTVPRMARRPI